MMVFVANLPDAVNIQLVLVLGVVLLLSYWLLSGPNHPNVPGPPRLPIIGSLPFMAYKIRQRGTIHKVLLDWRERYGDIYCLGVGSQNTFIINGFRYVSEVLREKGELINRRPTLHAIDVITQREGVLFSNGANWADMRKFAAVTMRELGLGKSSLEQRIQDEARITMGMIADMKEPFCPWEILLKSVCNIMCGICFGQRFDFRDPEFSNILVNLDTLLRTGVVLVPENLFPWIENVPAISKIPLMRECNNTLVAYMANRLREHEETFDADNIRDFMDLYIDMKRSGAREETLTDTHLFRTMVDLFTAGSETTASTMSWLLAYMLRYPEVQAECQQEIEQVVGSGRMVSMSDKPKLTYNMAVMSEIQRLANVVPLSLPHAAVEDFELGGYLVPKDSIIMVNLLTAHKDDTYWEAADQFRPERWIDDEGNLKRFDAFMPFSLGPRACLGKTLAEMEIFLFFTNFLQSFTFKLPEGTSPPSLEGGQSGVINLPEKYHLIAEKRI